MISAFRPLYAFIKLAIEPLLWFYVAPVANSGSAGNAFNGVTAARYPFEAARDRHQLAPKGRMAFVQVPWNAGHAPFTNRPTFEVSFCDAYSYCWVGKNSHARSIPPPPDRSGPVLCVCEAPIHVRAAPRFGSEAGGGSWFCPDSYSERAPSRAFALDLFSGAGPCAARDEPGFLTQWDPTWAECADDGGWQFAEHFSNHIIVVEASDSLIADAVNVHIEPLNCVVTHEMASIDDLRRAWSKYAVDVQRRRIPIMEAVVAQGLWKKLKDSNHPAWRELNSEGYLKAGCVGAWFKEPLARLDVLLDFYRKGIPVFYPWSAELGRRAPELTPSQELRDAMQPLYDDMLPMPLPPMMPAPPLARSPSPSPARIAAALPAAGAPPAEGASAGGSAGDRVEQGGGPHGRHGPRLARPEDAPMDEDEPVGSYGGIPDEQWDRIARELDAQDAAVALPPVLENPPPPYRPVPMEGRDYFLVEGQQLRMTTADDVLMVPCRRADLYISRLVSSEADFLGNLGRPRSRTTLNAAAVVLPELLTRMGVEALVTLEDDVHLVVFKGGLVTKALEYAVRHGLVANRTELIDFLIDNGMRFSTGVRVVNAEPALTNHWHNVPAGPWFDVAAPVTTQFAQWCRAVQTLLEKPHVARAALGRGGVVSMAVRALADPRYPLRPTVPTIERGSPNAIHYRGLELYDDYLADDEVKIILGYPDTSAQRSLLPSSAAFNDSFAGVVTRGMAEWFQSRMFELSTGFQGRTGNTAHGVRSGNEWRKAIRNELLNWYEPKPKLEGGAL
ncbi:hypothetical protein AURDEDRAFT_169425 [Auricularia subglabra TFB-10046 SS5]|nr:hypothetical protein AURDEDRAFT_169425 [Auricularia subglabra TFB-10046 SS5]